MEKHTDDRAPDQRTAQDGSNWRTRLLGPEAGLIALQCLFIFYTRVTQNEAIVDDAYIHFRNAANWARGLGLVYNPGETVLGTTSPLYALILGLAHRITGADLPRIATGLNFLCDLGIMASALVWLRRARVPLLFRHAVVFILSAELLRMFYSSTGMEMSLFVLGTLAVAECSHRGRWIVGGVLLGALGWIRPEAVVVWFAVAASMGAARQWRELGKFLAVAVSVALLFVLILTLKFGTFIPQSLLTKREAPWFIAASGLAHVEFFINLGNLTPFYPINRFNATWDSWGDKINSSLVAFAQIFLMLAGLYTFWRRELKSFSIFCLVFSAGYYAFYAIVNPQIFYWYFVPFFFFSLFLSGAGWWSLIDGGLGWAQRKYGLGRRSAGVLSHVALTVYFVLAVITAAHLMVVGNLSTGDGPWKALLFRYEELSPGHRETLYVRAAERLNSWIGDNHDARVGCAEIGAFGFHFKGKVLDAYGLVSPEVLEAVTPESLSRLPPSSRVFPISVYLTLKPEYIVTASIFLPDPPAEFFDVYREVRCPDIDLRFFAREDVVHTVKGGVVLPRGAP